MIFEKRLILNQWMLSLFGAKDFDSLKKRSFLDRSHLEGFTEDGTSKYFSELLTLFGDTQGSAGVSISEASLRIYDSNIVRFWNEITERRPDREKLHLKYFQYIALLFTEVYLDWYFFHTELLLAELNKIREEWNKSLPVKEQWSDPFVLDDLRMIAYWMATGSGKTLLMHVNIKQYLHYLELARRSRELNRIILVTPNEGLSKQHLEEFWLSGIEADYLKKEGSSLYRGKAIEILEITKLQEESGDTTVAVEAFEGNNLVLVDEGHRGAREDGVWMERRRRLCEGGFSFEYSATFGQAVGGDPKDALFKQYAASILFDYSYKYFHRDGFGKDFQILNLPSNEDKIQTNRYLVACLTGFFQQKVYYKEKSAELHGFQIADPLWIFVGGSVTKSVRTKDNTDVLAILEFLADFANPDKRKDNIKLLKELLSNKLGLLDRNNADVFKNQFSSLQGYYSADAAGVEQLYNDILKELFQSETSGLLHIEFLKGGEGEILLKLGTNLSPFGLINIGDASGLKKLCDQSHYLGRFVVSDQEFSESFFQGINKPDSPINILIGSRKFSEGWSSWRVSTMGLMNIGVGEGPQIIQLFGRGVRLKGFDFKLKRSSRLSPKPKIPKDIDILETLNVFGIKSDYLEAFRDFLEKEEVESEKELQILELKIQKQLPKPGTLKVLQVQPDHKFKDEERPVLGHLPASHRNRKVVCEWFIPVQVGRSAASANISLKPQPVVLEAKHIAFIDWDSIYRYVQETKNERAWYNMEIPRAFFPELFKKSDWYQLFLPENVLDINSFLVVFYIQKIVANLAIRYCELFYKLRKAEFDSRYLEYATLTESDPNFLADNYTFYIPKEERDFIESLRQFIDNLSSIYEWTLGDSHIFQIAQHLYQPLVYLEGTKAVVKPLVLDEPHEYKFLDDLRHYLKQNPSVTKSRQIYLLRNISRKGYGFFEAGNFYPDFLFWILDEQSKKQYLTFIDPKGIRNMKGLDDPKIKFFKTLKGFQERLQSQDPLVVLDSYILSHTEYDTLPFVQNGLYGSITVEMLEENHVLFMGGSGYIEKLLKGILQG